jgi:hypothetical protein
MAAPASLLRARNRDIPHLVSRISHLAWFIVLSCLTASAADVEPHAFLQQHCLKCHGDKKQKADRRFDALKLPIASVDDLESWQEIVDQLTLFDMPPDDEEVLPTDAERLEMIGTLTDFITAARAEFADTGGHTVLRRLNAVEYRYTINDLLGLNTEAWNPAADFPAEVETHGFDNNGAALVTSSMLLDHYLRAAESVLDRSTYFGERPTPGNWTQQGPFHFQGRTLKKKSDLAGQTDLYRVFNIDKFRPPQDGPWTDLTSRFYRGGTAPFFPLAGEGVPYSGTYKVRVRAAALNRNHPYGDHLPKHRNGDPLVMELVAVDRKASVTDSRLLGLVELTDETPKWFDFDVFIERGYEIEVRFRNGTGATKSMLRILMKGAAKFPELAPLDKLKPGSTERAHAILKVYRGPRLRVHNIELAGPFFDEWPPQGHRVIYGDLTEDATTSVALDQLDRFAESAFRRPPADAELVPIRRLVQSKIEAGMKPIDAYQLGVQTLLCAPGFAYLDEGDGALSGYALASRLSYFLWRSLPDAKLLKHAADGSLTRPDVLQAETERLLSDAKANRFISDFNQRWLELDNIGEMPPSREFDDYYRDALDTAMRTETEMFFADLLERNGSIRRFLDADYTFLNRELAAHYGIADVAGAEFQRVALKDPSRGGLLGQGSFLTASANGVDTSPVVRGIYVLEKVLGYTPPPPPDDVPEIEPDIRGATTIRDQLKKHREIASCAECHRKIDPLGFALENFDAIGGWREAYGKDAGRAKIDASGKLPSGKTFSNAGEFKRLLVEQDDKFARCLTEKLMTFALGREVEIGDRPAIDKILVKHGRDGSGLRDLVKLVVLSESFRKN